MGEGLSARWSWEPRPACPVCGTGAAPPFLSLPFDQEPLSAYLGRSYRGGLDPADLGDARYELVRCPDCGLVYQGFAPGDADLDDLYGRLAKADLDEVRAARGLSTRLSYLHDLERVVRHRGGDPLQVRVLDFGAGTGLWLQAAVALGCRTAASELTEAGLASLARVGHEVHVLDDLPDGAFDLINAEQVFEHLVRPREVLERLVPALRPGGLVRLSVPNGSDIGERLAGADWAAPKGSAASLNAVAPLEHLNCFDHRSLVRLGQTCGLRPFTFPLRTEVHAMARMRFAASSVKHRLRPPGGTLLFFTSDPR